MKCPLRAIIAYMHLTIPGDLLPMIELDRHQPDGRVFDRGLPPPCGIALASWLRQFVRSHHDLPIAWPDPLWVWENREQSRTNRFYIAPTHPMVRLSLRFAPHAIQLLRARAGADGASQSAVLRRLLVQHFGRRPAAPVRTTGGRHVRTPGQGPDCITCAV
jgi:hypothetical protein